MVSISKDIFLVDILFQFPLTFELLPAFSQVLDFDSILSGELSAAVTSRPKANRKRCYFVISLSNGKLLEMGFESNEANKLSPTIMNQSDLVLPNDE